MSDRPKLRIEKRVLKSGRVVLVVNEEDTRRLRAENRVHYERRLMRTKGCRANIFGKI